MDIHVGIWLNLKKCLPGVKLEESKDKERRHKIMKIVDLEWL